MKLKGTGKSLTLIVFILVLSLMLGGCKSKETTMAMPTPTPKLIPTFTSTNEPSPTSNNTATPEPTATATVVLTATSTPEPIYVTLGSPFAADCGDGIPRIRSNDSFNASGDHQFDEFHGHVDIFVPSGCDVFSVQGELISPATGYISKGRDSYQLLLPDGTFIKGVENALTFSGEENVQSNLISRIIIDLGHVEIIEGHVEKGQSIGEIIPYNWQQKIAYQIIVKYKGQSYLFSPTLFNQDGEEWICYPNSPYDCEPESHDYAN